MKVIKGSQGSSFSFWAGFIKNPTLSIFLFVSTLSGCLNPNKTDFGTDFYPGIYVSTDNSLITVSSATVESGSSVTLTLHLKDTNYNPFVSTLPVVAFTAVGGTSTGLIGAVTNNHNGTYQATFTGLTTGTATTIHATVDGAEVASTLPTVTVTSGSFSLSNSLLTLSAASVLITNTVTATLTVYDAANNPLTAGGLTVVFSNSGGTSNGTWGATTDVGNGTYTAVFTSTTSGTATTVSASISGSAITSALPTLTVSGAFTNTWPFDFNTTASYDYDPLKIDFTGGVCRLTGTDQVDDANDSTGFAGGSLVGSSYDATNSYVRLTQTGTPTNNAELDSSWTPKWSNLISYWKMNNDWNDSKGSNNGTANGALGFTTSAKLGSHAGSFNSTDSYVTVASNVTIPTGNSARSIQAWIYTTNSSWAVDANTVFFYGNTATRQGFGLDMDVSPNLQFFSWGDDATFDSGLSQQGWFHFLVTYDGNVTAKIYINGNLVSTKTFGAQLNTTASTLYIGSYTAGSSVFNGNIDDVAIWSAALTASEVQAIYDRQKSVYSGIFTSRIMDAKSSSSWTTLSWIPTLPFMKELPDYASGAIQNESSTDYSSLVGSNGSTGDNNLMSGIVGLWHLNETAATAGANNDFKDDSGQGNHGEMAGALTFGETGKLEKSAKFDGTSAYIAVPDAVSLEGFTNLSMSAWVYIAATPAAGHGFAFIEKPMNAIGANVVDPYQLYGLGIDQNLKINFTISTGASGSRVFLTSANAVPKFAWTHIAAVYNGATMKTYINGVLDPTTAATTITIGTNANSLLLGALAGIGWFEGMNGLIDEVGIWNRGLHASEILQLYRRGANRLKHQVRICTAADCSDDSTGANWKGPDGTNQTYFSELNNNTTALDGSGDVKKDLPSMLFSAFTSPVGTSRYFQYRTILESDDTGTGCDYGSGATWCSPELKSVTVDPVHYDSSSPTVIGKTGVSFYSLATYAETLGASCASGVGYNLGVGAAYSSATWYYWSGAAWVAANGTATQSNTAAVVSTNAASFSGVAGTGTVYFKAFLQSSGTSQCELDKIDLTGQQ